MLVVEVLIVALVLFAIAAAMSGRGGSLAPFPVDGVPRNLPDDRPVLAEDVGAVRFDLGLRGYRMDEVDDVLDRLADELAARDARIAELSLAVGRAQAAHEQ